MFGENCFLCLESIGDSIDQIAVDSAECQALNLQQLLEKHFERELNGTLSWTTTSVLCCKCWTAISIFHEFCLRVQRAHAELANTLQPPKELINEDNVEKEVVHRSADSPPKRRRERPRRAASKLNKRLPEELADIQIAECKTENANLNPSLCDAKHAALQEDLIYADCSAESREAQYVVELVASAEHTQNSDTCSDVIDADGSDDLLVPLEYHTQNSQSDLNKKDEEEWTNQRLDEYISKHIKLSCCLCGCSFNHFFDLKDHFQAQHQTNGYVRCCGKKLVNRPLLVDHLHLHENPEYFKCSQCGKILADRVGLKKHLKLIHKSGSIFSCKICSKSFTCQSVLRLHESRHIPIDQRKFTCSQCDKTFAREVLLNRHMMSTHQNKFFRICEICGIPLHTNEFFQRHMDEHAGINWPIQCKECGITLVSKNALESHMRRIHTRSIPQTCSICSKVSPNQTAHKAHVWVTHTSKLTHSCPICKKGFKNLVGLKEHKATHTGEDLHPCTFCRMTFRFYSNMHRHQKNFHLKEWTESRLQRGRVVRRVDMEKYELIMAKLVES